MFKHTLLAAGLVIAFAAAGTLSGARAAGPEGISGNTHVTVTPMTSQADLAKQLEKMGYTEVLLTPARPTDVDPRPDMTDCTAHGSPVNSPVVPCHPGWNGTAVHNGKRVNIMVDEKGAVQEK